MKLSKEFYERQKKSWKFIAVECYCLGLLTILFMLVMIN